MASLVTFTAGTPILSTDVNANFTALNTALRLLTYGPTISAPDAATGNWFLVSVIDAAAHAFAAPLHPTAGKLITLTVHNFTGGAIATATFAATYHVAGYVPPAAGFLTSACLISDATNWFQVTPWFTGIVP